MPCALKMMSVTKKKAAVNENDQRTTTTAREIRCLNAFMALLDISER